MISPLLTRILNPAMLMHMLGFTQNMQQLKIIQHMQNIHDTHQQTYKAKSSKTAKPNLANQTCQTKPTNQTCQNKYTEPNLPNWTNHNWFISTYVQYLWALDLQCLEWFCDVRELAWFFNLLICLKQWTPGSVVPLAIFHICIYWAARIVDPIYCPEIV